MWPLYILPPNIAITRSWNVKYRFINYILTAAIYITALVFQMKMTIDYGKRSNDTTQTVILVILWTLTTFATLV